MESREINKWLKTQRMLVSSYIQFYTSRLDINHYISYGCGWGNKSKHCNLNFRFNSGTTCYNLKSQDTQPNTPTLENFKIVIPHRSSSFNIYAHAHMELQKAKLTHNGLKDISFVCLQMLIFKCITLQLIWLTFKQPSLRFFLIQVGYKGAVRTGYC